MTVYRYLISLNFVSFVKQLQHENYLASKSRLERLLVLSWTGHGPGYAHLITEIVAFLRTREVLVYGHTYNLLALI